MEEGRERATKRSEAARKRNDGAKTETKAKKRGKMPKANVAQPAASGINTTDSEWERIRQRNASMKQRKRL